jgi:hypothetical protein
MFSGPKQKINSNCKTALMVFSPYFSMRWDCRARPKALTGRAATGTLNQQMSFAGAMADHREG